MPAIPSADELLKRDLGNVLRFFQRKYNIEMPLEEALSACPGGGEDLSIFGVDIASGSPGSRRPPSYSLVILDGENTASSPYDQQA